MAQEFQISEGTPFPELDGERYYCVANDTALEVAELVQQGGVTSCSFNVRHGDIRKCEQW